MNARRSQRTIPGTRLLFAALVLSGCSDNLPNEPPVQPLASVEVHSVTVGLVPDGDYTLRLDGDSVAQLSPTASVLLADLTPGPAVLSISGVGHFCEVRGENPHEVTLEPGSAASVTFSFVCDPIARVSQAALESISAATLRGYVYDLAADSALGRSTWDDEISKVAAYVGTAFTEAGLQPPASSDMIEWWTTEDGITGPNVIGWIPGSDPELSNEHVLFVAHFDHLGYRTGYYPDSVFNGANDNASGTAALLQLASAFGMLDPAPPRSLVFLAVSGEEEGLVGSEQYAKQPAFQLDATHVVMNFDMVGKPMFDSFYVRASDDHQYARLTADLLQYVALSDVDLRLGFYLTNSDGRTFAQEGLEVVEFFSGENSEYHTRADEAHLLDYEFMEEEIRLAFLLAVEMASWDGTG